jgi:type I restriction-modification system DNA methylase subunit
MQTDFVFPDFILKIEQKVKTESTYSKEKSDEHGEVFTPFELINEMLDQIPESVWSDSTKTVFDPCAGKGNFPIQIIKRFMKGLAEQIPNPEERYKHIMKNNLFMSEFQDTSAQFIRDTFIVFDNMEINLHEGDTLTMPSDYFDKKDKNKPQPIITDNIWDFRSK